MPYTHPEDFVIARLSAPMSPGLNQLARAFVVCCAALAVFAGPAAAAPPPCWKTMLNDWYDGHIDHTYPIPCYQQAIDHLPRDIQNYSSAKDDIQRARRQAIAVKNHTTTTTASSTPGPGTTTTTTTTKKPRGPLKNVIRDLTPGGADSFPLPLLILGLLAILLVLAGVGGMAWRRYQTRHETP
jgi:hypothetical protein